MADPPPGPGGPKLSSAKKRRLAALENRSSAPPAKRPAAAAPSAAAARPPPAPSPRQQSNPLPAARHTAFGATAPPSGSTATAPAPKATEPQPATFEPLPDAVFSGPVAQKLGLLGAGSLADMLQQLMATNPRTSDARAVLGGKLRDKAILLDTPGVRREQGRRGGGGVVFTGKLASRKEQRAQGLYDLKSAPDLMYAALEPLHRKWQEYVHALTLPTQTLKELHERVQAADLHGCFLRVAEASEPRLVGLRGIVVRDSSTAFQLVTPDDRLVLIPKKPCVFEFSLDAHRVVTLLGAGLAAQAAARQQHQKGGANAKNKNR